MREPHEPRHRLREVQELFTNYAYCTNCTDEVARSTSVIFVNYTIMQRDLHELHEFFRRLASRVLKSTTNGGRNLTEMC